MKTLFNFSRFINRISIILSLVLFCLAPLASIADNIITSGTTLKVSSGTSLVSMDNLKLQSGATLDNSGTLILKKNLTNENASPNSIGSGTAELSGTVGQNVNGQNVINNLTVNNSAGIQIGGNTQVNGNLTLSNGLVTLGSNNLTLGPAAVIVGSPSASVMIVVTGTGELRKEFPVGFAGTFTCPVGDNTGTAEYSPVVIVVSGGTFAAGNYVGVSLKNEKYPDPNIEGNYLNRYWTLSQSGISNLVCNATFQYLVADVVGTENKLSCSRVNPLPLVTYGQTNATTHILSANGVLGFGSFTGMKSTVTPENQQLANVVIPSGLTTCYDAAQVLTVAGNGTTFIVESGGNITLVAGNKISMLDGTKVYSGGYLHGYITTNGTFCGSMLAPMVATTENSELTKIVEATKNHLIKVYPNPTTDIVIVELIDAGLEANVTVYSMVGGKLLQRELKGDNKFQFSLAGRPVGIYLVRVQAGEQSEIAKVVKK